MILVILLSKLLSDINAGELMFKKHVGLVFYTLKQCFLSQCVQHRGQAESEESWDD